MGGCVSTHGKSRRRRARNSYAKGRRGSRGSATFVIPISQSSLGDASQKYKLDHNARQEFADGGPGNALLIERPIPSSQISGNSHGHTHLDRQQSGATNSNGSKDETFFETDLSFNSDDEYMSVHGDFSSSTDNSLTYPCNSAAACQRPSVGELQVGMVQAENNVGGCSEKLTSPTNHARDGAIPNGLAALTGTTPDNFGGCSKSLDRSPRKNLQLLSSEDKVTPNRGKWGKSVSDLPGRKTNTSDASSGRNSARLGSPGIGDGVKSSDHKGVFDSLCIPRLRPPITSNRSRPISPRNVKKKGSVMRFSFKRHTSMESHDDQNRESSAKFFIKRPVAGSQVLRCSCDKPIDGCWSEVAPSVFKLRGKHYSKDKKKYAAPDYALFVPIGVDLFMSSQKLDHIAQYVELPYQDSLTGSDTLARVFIVNIQLPLYPPAIFLGDGNGDGLSLVLYFKLSEESIQQAPPFVKEMLRKFVSDEMEKVKGFIGETHHAFRDRLKVVARLVNPQEVHFSGPERKLLANYNEKPVLSRPQHCFYRGENYLEVDLDVHRFSYIARKGFDTLRERLKNCVLDIGLTIQATKQEELPEQVLAAVRLHKLDFGDFKILQRVSTAHSMRTEDSNGVPSSP